MTMTLTSSGATPAMRNPADEDSLELGTINFHSQSDTAASVCGILFDRLAVVPTTREILVLSVFTEAMRAKALRATLGTAKRVTITATGVEVTQLGHRKTASVDKVNPTVCSHGYAMSLCKADLGMVHALFIAKHPQLLPVMDETGLWSILRSEIHTTPLLRGWCPWLMTELRNRKLLVPCVVYRANAAILTATTEQLDDVVSCGLRAGHIEIPDEDVIDVAYHHEQRQLEHAQP